MRTEKKLKESPPPQRPVVVNLEVEVFNSGEPSVIRDWELEVVAPNSATWKAQLQLLPNLSMVSANNAPDMHFNQNAWIVLKTRNDPVGTGMMVDGVITFMVPGVDRETLQAPGTRFRLAFRDVANRRYEIEQVMAGQGGFY